MQRHAWILFVVIGAIGLTMGIAGLFDPSIPFGMLSKASPAAPPAGLEGDPFFAFAMRWTATALVGVNAITIVVAATAFRRGERWAGVAFIYWPLMFVSHLVLYRWSPMSVVQVVWIALTVPALVAHFRRGGAATAVQPAA